METKSKIKSILFFMFLMLVSQIPMTIMTLPFLLSQEFALNTTKLSSTYESTFLSLKVITFITSIIIVGIFSYLYRRKQTSSFNKRRFFKYLGIGLVGQVLLLVLENVLANHGGSVAENQQLVENLFYFSPKLLTFLIVIFAPISEELLYRGIFFQEFFTKDNKWIFYLGIVVNGLFFAMLHEASFSLVMLPYFLMGSLFAYCYRSSKDLKVSITLHLLNNLLGVLALWGL